MTPRTIVEASGLLESKKLSAVELVTEHLDRIEPLNPTLNAFLHVDAEGALEAAKASDDRRSQNKSLGPLDGIPISVKDNIVTTGMPTTAGDRILDGFVSPYDATVIARLKEAGVIILGKTNCDAWGHGSSTENSAYGPSKNPWDTERVPGGSSGGSAAAVVAGLGLAGIGTDTGGSIRQPASLSGVTGFKPTYGRLSRYGLIAMASSLDCPGTLTRSAADACLLAHVMSGQDSADATSLPQAKIRPTADDQAVSLAGKKIGIPKEYFGEGLDRGVRACIEQGLETFERLGAELVEIELPMTKYGIATYYIIQPAEVSSNLARFDGIRYGKSSIINHQSSIKSADKLIRLNRTQGLGDEAKRRIMLGTYVLSSGYYDAYYKRAQQVRTVFREEFARAFDQVDLIASPASPSPAFKVGELANDPLAMYLMDVYTVGPSMAGLPGISIPCGFVELENEERSMKNGNDGPQAPNSILHTPRLPVGLQLLGPQLGDDEVLAAAQAFQRETDYHLQTPRIVQ